MIASLVPQNLHDYFNRIYWPKKLGRSPRTATLYRMAIDRFSEFLGAPATLANLNDDDVCGFLQHRLTIDERSEHTVDKERDKLRAIAEFAARKRHIAEFVDIPQISPPEKLPTCWRREHLIALLQACRETPGSIGAAMASDWWLAFHYVCVLTGERTEAMLSLRWDWLSGNVLSVPAKVRKGGKKPQRYILPKIAMVHLERLRGKTDVRIFAAPWKCVETFYNHYTRLLKRAGLPDSRDFKPQCLRRTFASFLEAGGGDATAALGHSSRNVTKASYLDTAITEAGKTTDGDIVRRQLEL